MKGLVNDLLNQGPGRFGAFAAAWDILLDASNAMLWRTAST
jgi:hypothetical protein